MSKGGRMCNNMINWNYLWKMALAVLLLVFYTEFGIYYVVLLRCSWPQLGESTADHNVFVSGQYKPVKAMVLADTHLLGPRRGHWFDKLRREWQMHRAFQSVMTVHNPDVVFFLGDIFDEGLWVDDEEFETYVTRFHSLFYTPERTKSYFAVGNHDIGFHYAMTKHLEKRFSKAFNSPAVNLVTIEGNVVVLVNSMAMEGDNCTICRSAEERLLAIGKRLHCDKSKYKSCEMIADIPLYTKPVLMQHMPLYRKSDVMCNEPDSAPIPARRMPHRERWDCLSHDSTKKLLRWLRPRLVFGGHTHHGCYIRHKGVIPEYTIASFSWRNRDDPSFLLVQMSPGNYAVSKCFLPQESTVIALYFAGSISLLIWICATRKRVFKSGLYAKIS